MNHRVPFPAAGMERGGSSQVALGAGWPASGDPGEVRAVAAYIGAIGGTVQSGKVRMKGIGEISPLHGMKGFLIAEVAPGAGDFGNPAQKVGPMTIGTRLHLGLRLHLMPAGQPSRRMLPGPGVQGGLRAGIPASRQQKAKRQQHQERRQRTFSYR